MPLGDEKGQDTDIADHDPIARKEASRQDGVNQDCAGTPETTNTHDKLLSSELNNSDDMEGNAGGLESEPITQDLAAERDRYLALSQRFAADLENYRNRTDKIIGLRVNAVRERFILKIVDLLDDMERGIQDASGKDTDLRLVVEGLDLIRAKTLRILEMESVTKFESLGQNFDPAYHEALFMVPVLTEEESGKVVKVLAEGYQWEDQVIRAAKVGVSKHEG